MFVSISEIFLCVCTYKAHFLVPESQIGVFFFKALFMKDTMCCMGVRDPKIKNEILQYINNDKVKQKFIYAHQAQKIFIFNFF